MRETNVSGCFTTPLEHTPKPFPTGYEGIPFIVGVAGGLFGVCSRGVLQFSWTVYPSWAAQTHQCQRHEDEPITSFHRLPFLNGEMAISLGGRKHTIHVWYATRGLG